MIRFHLHLVPRDGRTSTIDVLTVRDYTGETFKVFVQYRGGEWRGWCSCLEHTAHSFCRHLRQVCLGRACLVNEHDYGKMLRISQTIQGTAIKDSLKVYAKAELEMVRNFQTMASCQQALDAYVVCEPEERFGT